ncbi:cell envelope integrity protein TolA [Bosea sp. (in: a-proteobacteria)]|uniref:cell envelope integrity protein TolA n=1 Tax=Bosea sp. (in: a-proteobacteria) TaxID=1871050 RepID=UPI002FC700BC
MAVSALGHATFLVAGLLAFSSPTPLPEHMEAIAVEIIDPSALNQVTRGEREAEKVQEQPLQRAERQSEIVEHKEAGEAKQDTPAPPSRPAEIKVAEENVAAPLPPARPTPKPTPPAEPVKQPPEKAEAKAEPKPDLRREELAKLAEEAERETKAKQAEEDAKAAAKAKAEAEAQTRAEAAKAAKQKAEAEAKAKAEAEHKAKLAAEAKAKREAEAKAKREAEVAKNFNPNDIAKLLQSKEPAQSSGASAPQTNRTASLGTRTGASQKLSPSLRAQLMGIIQDQLQKCWNVPIALQSSQKPVVPQVRMKLNTDGSLLGHASVTNSSPDPLFRVAADSALTATRRCSPLRIPAQFAAYYDDWRDVVVNFDARDVL